MLPRAMCTGVMCETCTRVHSYLTGPLDASKLIADPALIPGDSEKPWHIWQMLDNKNIRVYVCV